MELVVLFCGKCVFVLFKGYVKKASDLWVPYPVSETNPCRAELGNSNVNDYVKYM